MPTIPAPRSAITSAITRAITSAITRAITRAIHAACLALAAAGMPAARAATGLGDFDPPTTAQGPSIFVALPGPQTIVAPVATFTGGVVLGLATNFPASPASPSMPSTRRASGIS